MGRELEIPSGKMRLHRTYVYEYGISIQICSRYKTSYLHSSQNTGQYQTDGRGKLQKLKPHSKLRDYIPYNLVKSKDQFPYNEIMNIEEWQIQIYTVLLAQYGIYKCVKLYGQDGADTMISELKQINIMESLILDEMT